MRQTGPGEKFQTTLERERRLLQVAVVTITVVTLLDTHGPDMETDGERLQRHITVLLLLYFLTLTYLWCSSCNHSHINAHAHKEREKNSQNSQMRSFIISYTA